MSKTQRHQNELIPLFSEFFQTGDKKKLIEYLLSNSNLPGRRANLELAKAFTMVVEENWDRNGEFIWDFISALIDLTPSKAPVNDPKEFLTFCATWALGTIGAMSEVYYNKTVQSLKELANDSRWRIREAVAKGIHKLTKTHDQRTLEELQKWISKDHWLAMRAVVTGVADPSLLNDDYIVKQALEFHKEVLNQVKECRNRKSEEFKVLRKGLAYSLSVVVQALPEEGFQYLKVLTESLDKDILWILKQNLKKNRLIKNYPQDVKAVNELLK